MKYSFGTSQAAALRLQIIAEFFDPIAAAFIRAFAKGPIKTALDLGCGPGFTTLMLAETLPDADVYGMDTSRPFLEMARDRSPEMTFLEHDVTQSPFPVRADVIYARFLLSHLPDVVRLVNRWADELAPQGLLFVDELEAIDTEVPVFRRYLEVNTGLVASHGADLFVGSKLAHGPYSHEVVSNTTVALPVSNVVAASWFHPNTMTIWRQEEYVISHVSESERTLISEELNRIRDSGDTRQDIVWHMRHLVLRPV